LLDFVFHCKLFVCKWMMLKVLSSLIRLLTDNHIIYSEFAGISQTFRYPFFFFWKTKSIFLPLFLSSNPSRVVITLLEWSKVAMDFLWRLFHLSRKNETRSSSVLSFNERSESRFDLGGDELVSNLTSTLHLLVHFSPSFPPSISCR
jgi:hypothetical protein